LNLRTDHLKKKKEIFADLGSNLTLNFGMISAVMGGMHLCETCSTSHPK